MVRYTSSAQTKITEFDEHYELRLDPDNRWIRLGKLLPWDGMAALYCRELSAHMGAGTVDPRHVIGAIIVKHKLGLSDVETLDTIGENPYMQVFLGLDAYRPGHLFSPTLLVEARKRLGKEAFDAFTEKIVAISCPGAGRGRPRARKGPTRAGSRSTPRWPTNIYGTPTIWASWTRYGGTQRKWWTCSSTCCGGRSP